MNKSELVAALSKKIGAGRVETETFVNSFIEIVEKTVAKGEPVQLIGFGTFELRHREARVGRNPKTGEKLNIPASNSPVFKAGKNFKDITDR